MGCTSGLDNNRGILRVGRIRGALPPCWSHHKVPFPRPTALALFLRGRHSPPPAPTSPNPSVRRILKICEAHLVEGAESGCQCNCCIPNCQERKTYFLTPIWAFLEAIALLSWHLLKTVTPIKMLIHRSMPIAFIWEPKKCNSAVPESVSGP